MRGTHAITLLLILLSTSGTSLAQDSQKALPILAILDFAGKGVESHEASIITDRFRSHLVQTGRFKVMERGQMEAILGEHGFQQSGACSDASCMIEVGQLLSVRKMVGGTVGKIGALYTIDVKVIDVATGEILLTHSHNTRGTIEDVFLNSLPELAQTFIQKLTGEKPVSGTIDVTSDPTGATVSIDSREAGTTPLKRYELPVGKHAIQCTLDNFSAQTKHVDIIGGQHTDISFNLSRSSEFVNRSSARRERAGRILRVTSGAVTLMGIAGAGLFHLDAQRQYQAYRDEHDEPEQAQALYEKVETASRFRLLSLGVTGLGLAGLGVSFAF